MNPKSIVTHVAVAAVALAGGMAIKGGSQNTSTEPGDTASTAGAKLSALGGSADKKSAKEKNSEKAGGATAGGSAFPVNKSSRALLADYLSSNDPLEQNYLFAQLLLGVTPENAAEIYESLKGKLTGRDGGRQMTLFFQAWGKVDGESAIAAASVGGIEMRGGPGRGSGFNVGSVLAGWAGTDPEAAKTWLNDLEDERQKGFLTFGLINGLAKSDPDSATDYVIELASAEGDDAEQTPWGGSFTSRYIDMIAEEKLKGGTASATVWADTLPDGDLKRSAYDEIAENLVRSDIDEAKVWVADHAGADYARDAVREVAESIARDDPQEALAWADSLPENAQPSVYSEAFGRWTREDAEGASQYLAGMEPSPVRDSAVQSLANALIFERDDEKRDPVSAAAWAVTIEDSAARTETVTNVARTWMRSDEAAATEWLTTSSGLSAEAQQEVIANPGRGGGGGGRDFGRRGR